MSDVATIVPSAELTEARQAVAQQAKALQSAVLELAQLSLLPEVEFEEALLLEPDEVKKRYTGTNGKGIIERREMVVKMLARQMTATDICDILKMNPRTVAAIAAQEGQKIAAFSGELANALVSSAMADIAAAQTKRDTASYKDQHIAAGIKLTHAAAMKLIGAGGGEEAVNVVEAENPALLQARKWLEDRRPKPIEPQRHGDAKEEKK